jgi:hypothetical protein
MLDQFLLEIVGWLLASVQGDVAVDALALDIVRITDNGCFGNLWVRDKCAFDFGCSHAVAGNVDDVIDATGDPVVAILVAAGTVTGEVVARIRREVGLHEALMVLVDGAHLTWPAIFQDQVAVRCAFQFRTLVVDECWANAEEWIGCRTGFQFRRASQRGDQNSAGFSLPPGIDDRALRVADNAVIPIPSFRVDRLSNRTQKAQR